MKHHLILSSREYTIAVSALANCILEQAHIVERMCDGSSPVGDCCQQARRMEQAAESKAAELDSNLDSVLVAPVDRIAACALVNSLRNVGHQLRRVCSDASAAHATLPNELLQPIARELVASIERTARLLSHLDDTTLVSMTVIELHRDSQVIDELYVSALEVALATSTDDIVTLQTKAVLDSLRRCALLLHTVVVGIERLAFVYA